MSETKHSIGWIGVGNMGRPLVSRLLDAGCEVAVYNRTRAKAEALAEFGATVVDKPADLAGCDIVFTVVSGPDDFIEVTTGPGGLLTSPGATPQVLVDCSTISAEASERVRRAAADRGMVLIAAPISGNGKHVAAGGALFAVSGPKMQADLVRPYLEILGRGAHYMGEGDNARLVKIAHNLFLGAIIQSLVETTLLAQSSGVSRAAYLEFINQSALGSEFSAYKTPALVDLDWAATFTTKLLRKDLDLGLAAAGDGPVRLPVTKAVRDLIQAAIDAGYENDDFAVLLQHQADIAGIELADGQAPTAVRLAP